MRKRKITRRIKYYQLQLILADTENESFVTKEITFPKVCDEDNLFKKVSDIYSGSPYTLIKIKEVNCREDLYEMEESLFLKHATLKNND